MENSVYSLCFMCSARCPIKVTVKDGQVKFIEGNPHVPGIEGSVCPRGSASIAQLYDSERVQSPMIRVGDRGAGQWRKAGWDEALDYVASKLKPIIKKHGGHSVVLGERTQFATHVSKRFSKPSARPITSPTMRSARARSTPHAAPFSDTRTRGSGLTTRIPDTLCCMAATSLNPSKSKKSMA
jgi:anaerobic selenocysteine-containing dehydrogenase